MSIFGLYRVEKWSYEVGAVSYHKIYGLYSVGHRKVEISGDVTKVGRTDGRTNKQQRKIQLLRF